MINNNVALEVLSAADLGLSALPIEANIDDYQQYAFGVIDGMKLALGAFATPELVAGEVFEKYFEGDLAETLNERSRVVGMLAGALATIKLVQNTSQESEEEKL